MSRAMELSVVARCRGSFLGPVQAGLRPASGDQPYPSMMSLRLRVFPRLETFSAKRASWANWGELFTLVPGRIP